MCWVLLGFGVFANPGFVVADCAPGNQDTEDCANDDGRDESDELDLDQNDDQDSDEIENITVYGERDEWDEDDEDWWELTNEEEYSSLTEDPEEEDECSSCAETAQEKEARCQSNPQDSDCPPQYSWIEGDVALCEWDFKIITVDGCDGQICIRLGIGPGDIGFGHCKEDGDDSFVD